MGTVYPVPNIGDLTFDNASSVAYSSLDSSQKTAYDMTTEDGLQIRTPYNNYPWYGFFACSTTGSYFAPFSSNNKFSFLMYRPVGKTYYASSGNNIVVISATVVAEAYIQELQNPTEPIGVCPLDLFPDRQSAYDALMGYIRVTYPITYSYSNSTVSGPSEAAVGDTVTVSAVPDNNYGITDPASQILVTNNDIPVDYNWNPSTNSITFVMPDPS